MATSENFVNPLRKFKLVFLGEQSGKKRVKKNVIVGSIKSFSR